MKKFLRKYWINIAYAILAAILIFVFIPNEENHYLKSDVDAVKSKTRSVVIWTIMILLITIIILLLRNVKKISELLAPLFGALCLGLAFFFLFDIIFLSGAFLLNKITIGKNVEKQYRVSYLNKAEGSMLLYDDATRKTVFADRLLSTSGSLQIERGNIITISFKKGLLGFYFDPKIKPD